VVAIYGRHSNWWREPVEKLIIVRYLPTRRLTLQSGDDNVEGHQLDWQSAHEPVSTALDETWLQSRDETFGGRVVGSDAIRHYTLRIQSW
jgi:hypothetical protein